ncbi:aromatic-L-amino-acid decarboxylase [Haloferax mucosum ATCC BAA-1512]|uniref:Aromatic-L-amino-acid decarboxylase n=1 Tax=Haloferax mucosum ATCC BAA-1512 TaxID=662479 RepID=M0IGR1_9EURY|nr:pyridoxal-dependent decarboxylase [Haloferax mucosum]ELZ95951.1 aromatic-L-amino-acid decarboxylase [Haloferax mucosum ATCC BAA-1512]
MHSDTPAPDDVDMDPDEFRMLGYRAVDTIAAYFEALDELDVFPGQSPTDVEQLFDETLPETGQAPDAILDEWSDKVLPTATHNTSPRYFGFVMGSGTMMGVLADALAASVNMNTGGWKPAPSGTEVERRTIRWLAELIGYDPDCGGLFTSGGTMANVTGILTGLRETAEYDTKTRGIQTDDRAGRFTLYVADHEGHSSIYRVAELLGLGSDAVHLVPSHDDFTMDVEALERLVEADRDSGAIPFCVVAQVGSINVGAIDPLEDIARVCEEQNLWFHADGACGAVGAVLPEKRPQYRGIERADSVTLDPHKWLYVPYECGCLLVRDQSLLAHVFAMDAAYLEGKLPTKYEGLDYYELGPQMSRGFRALKVWMSLKHYGVSGYRALLRRNVACAEHLDALVRSAADFEALHEPNLYIYSFRYAPNDLQQALRSDPEKRDAIDDYLDTLNQRIADEIRERGLAFVMTTAIYDRTVLRLSICSHRTTRDDIDDVFETFRELGEREDRARRDTLDVASAELTDRFETSD